MKTKKTILFSLAALVALGLMSFDILYGTGEADFTGSPADGGADCTACHADNPVNTGGGSVAISASPAFFSGEYVPGMIYTIDVTVVKTGLTGFGFGFEALKTGNIDGGTLAVLNSNTQIIPGSSATNMVQSGVGIGTGTFTFTFKWTAPAAGAGTITFYASGNATNEDGSTTGDFVYTTSLAATEGPSSVGMVNYNSISAVAAYPNPASGYLSIGNTSNESLNLIMYDLSGKVALISDGISGRNNTISILDVPNGTYILKAYNQNGLVKSDRIVVMH